MRFSVLLALASGLLTHALQTGLNISLNAVNARPEWTPNLRYPAGYSPATCPLRPGSHPFCALEVQGRKKRSVTTATHLRPRNEICRQIGQCSFKNFPDPIYNTQENFLIAGTIYVFSWALDMDVISIGAFRRNPNHTITHIQSTGVNARTGTMMLILDQPGYIWFHIVFFYEPASGEIALFQIGPG